ncbi:hypothetical protein ACIQC5_05350 [Paenarthrobacter sp. NPDC092416]|uniref:hypothetical protein n=1 Tax=Paenarthrobacter sp. NPDC092416 TaxID=3364386 RepID=UPI0037F31B7A
MNELFGAALGRWLAEGVGLRSAYVPDGVSRNTAAAIVESANNTLPPNDIDGLPFSLLVADNRDSPMDEIPTITAAGGVQYRHGLRLLVVHGRHPELASITSSFPAVIDKSFPSGATRQGLRSLARQSLRVVFDAARIQREAPNSAVEVLASTFEDSRSALEKIRQGSKPWNACWFEHASTALVNLSNSLVLAREDNPALDLERLLSDYIPAAFGLPQRGLDSAGKGTPFNATKFKDAAEAAWSDEETIRTTVQQLAHHPDTAYDSHPLAAVEWGGFDQTLAIEDNIVLALAKHGRDKPGTTQAFASLTYRQFVDPWTEESLRSNLRVFRDPTNPHGMSISEQAESGPDLVEVYFTSPEEPALGLESDVLHIRIPTFSKPSQELVDNSQAEIVTSLKSLRWSGVLTLENDELWAVGKFSLPVGRFPLKVPARPATLRVNVASMDPLAPMVDQSKTRQLLFAITSVPGCWVQRMDDAGTTIGKIEYVGTERIVSNGNPEDLDVSWTTDEVGQAYRFLAWGSEDGPQLDFESAGMNSLHGRPHIFEFSLKISDQDEFDIATCHFVLRAVQNSSTDFSPLIAAINNNRISSDEAPTEMKDSLPGKYESIVAERIFDQHWLLGLGHVILPTDQSSSSITEAEWSEEHNVLMPPRLGPSWNDVFGGVVSEELLYSAEAEQFRQAFLDLGIEELVQPTGYEGSRNWPSRISWRHLWSEKREALDGYLLAHTALIKKAEQLGNPFGMLWAAYPFSMSGWSTATAAQCQAIYISPLHPLRLAWLASVEHTIVESTKPEALAGTIEGWKFPYIGPCGTLQGFALGVPCDAGPAQLFMGWALLVSAELQIPKPLQAPYRFGHDPLPGNTASGLNATSASAALRDFHRLHPQVSTLSIDLASTVHSQRLSEIDEAVVDAVALWASNSSADLPGGVRVLDSLNRRGDIPRLAASRLLATVSNTPFSWTRYEHVPGKTQRCNVRLLQDSGVALFAGPAAPQDGPHRGLVGNVPLRRFELQEATGLSKRSTSLPALHDGVAPTAFNLCLQALEGDQTRPKVTTMIHNSILVDPRADWTVSGEAMINPGAMSSMIQEHGSGSQMLWEWRPPFLGMDDSIPALDRRPFISVARVPPSFRSKLSRMLQTVKGQLVSDSEIDTLLGVLGARGIGLSSLLTMSENHSSGAVGFYLSLKLMEGLARTDCDDFVIPLDACDVFLRAMTGTKKPRTRDKRADLLSIRVSEGNIVLTPIEIKSYGLGSHEPDHVLPGPAAGAFNEPTTQLLSTVALLRLLVKRHTEDCSDRDSADAAIWSNALASLVEVGMKLTPRSLRDLDQIARRFQRIIDSNLSLRMGKPLVAYFSHGAYTSGGQESAAYFDLLSDNGSDQFEFGAHVVNTSAAFASIDDLGSDIIQQWRSLVDWATSEDDILTESEHNASDDGSESAGTTDPMERTHGEGGQKGFGPTEGRATVRVVGEEILTTGSANQDHAKVHKEGVRISVGHLLHSVGDAEADFWPSNTALNQMNVGVVGDLGTGKTQLLKALVYQLRRTTPRVQAPPLSVLIFDYKRDFQDPAFLQSVHGRVLHPHKIPLNLFSISGQYSRQKAYQTASRFGSVLQRIYSGIGPKQMQRLNDVVVELFDSNHGSSPTLSDVYFSYLEAVAAPDALSAILQSFHYNEVFTDDPAEFRTFAELLNDTVLVVAIDSFGTDQNMKNSIVTLFLNMYYDHMLGSTKWPYTGDEPQLRNLNSFLLVDEAVNIMEYRFPVLQQLLLQGREYGFGVILCSQYLSHFRQGDVNFGEPLLTWFIHKVPSVRTSELHHLGLTSLSDTEAVKIPQLKKHQALYSSLNHPGEFIAGTPYYRLVAEEE